MLLPKPIPKTYDELLHDMDALIIPGYSYDIRKAADNVRKLIGLIN